VFKGGPVLKVSKNRASKIMIGVKGWCVVFQAILGRENLSVVGIASSNLV
jgi:hypothetical protein